MNFDVAFERLIGHEGGYVDHPSDPGGETNFGISKRSYPGEDIRGMTLERAKAIYRRDFWGPAGCDAVPDALKFDLFDAAVNSGVRAAVKLLQRAAGAVDDGVLGPKTLLAVGSMDPGRLLARFNGHRLDMMNDLPTWPSFGKGWAQRIAENLKGGLSMDWKDLAGVVGKAAPILGTVLGGPAGGAIGGLVAAALGADPTPDAVAAAVANDPAAAVKLREVETTHQQRLQELTLEQAKAELADIASARSRDVEMTKAGRHNTRADVMVLSAAVGLLACLLSLVVYKEKIPPEAVGIISTIAGLFGACLKDAFTFEFGSSRSSQGAKDATIRDLSR